MPWKGTSVSEEKLRFIAEYLKGEVPMTALCAAYGVSRETGYQLVRRYRAEGVEGLAPRSRAPHRPGNETDASVVSAIVALR